MPWVLPTCKTKPKCKKKIKPLCLLWTILNNFLTNANRMKVVDFQPNWDSLNSVDAVVFLGKKKKLYQGKQLQPVYTLTRG